MLQVHPKSFLRQRGWFTSFRARRSVDIGSEPIPWWNYGVIDFVQERLQPTMSVLEFGSGGSSVWLAARTRDVVTVENDAAWAKVVRSFAPGNVTVLEVQDPGQLTATDLPRPDQRFDVLIVDAFAHRINCAKAGLALLNERGVVIWDNTDGTDWPEIQGMMQARGFRDISFTGLAPQEVSQSRTSIFYRQANVFAI